MAYANYLSEREGLNCVGISTIEATCEEFPPLKTAKYGITSSPSTVELEIFASLKFSPYSQLQLGHETIVAKYFYLAKLFVRGTRTHPVYHAWHMAVNVSYSANYNEIEENLKDAWKAVIIREAQTVHRNVPSNTALARTCELQLMHTMDKLEILMVTILLQCGTINFLWHAFM